MQRKRRRSSPQPPVLCAPLRLALRLANLREGNHAKIALFYSPIAIEQETAGTWGKFNIYYITDTHTPEIANVPC